jgi:hypothetical protein
MQTVKIRITIKDSRKSINIINFITKNLSCGGKGSCKVRQNEFEGVRYVGLVKNYARPLPIKT